MQATMTNMNVCETCYFHLVEYLGNIVKKKQNKKCQQQTKKQQLNNKNKSREQTKIYFREQRTNQCQQTKRWAVGSTVWGRLSFADSASVAISGVKNEAENKYVQ